MNTILIVLPILTLLMFNLGLTLQPEDFKILIYKPKAVVIGLLGQIVILPAIAFVLAAVFRLNAIFYVGVILIACCPGGSSSNIFSLLAKVDAALSVVLTALSSVITLFTIPLLLHWAFLLSGIGSSASVHLPVGNILVQNILFTFIPILIGLCIRRYIPTAAGKIETVLSKIAFPALIFLAGMFFVQHYKVIYGNIRILGACITILIILATGSGSLLARIFKLDAVIRRTIIIEVGMQNAAQAIAIASSPFIFNDDTMAVPAIVYALMMNIILLTYTGIIKFKIDG